MTGTLAVDGWAVDCTVVLQQKCDSATLIIFTAAAAADAAAPTTAPTTATTTTTVIFGTARRATACPVLFSIAVPNVTALYRAVTTSETTEAVTSIVFTVVASAKITGI